MNDQIDLDFTSEHLRTMTDAVKVVIRGYKIGKTFHGHQLHDDVAAIYPRARTCYTDTIQRVMRKYFRYNIRCIDIKKSLYEKWC